MQNSFFGIPLSILPKIKSSSEIYGHIKDGILKGVPIGGVHRFKFNILNY